MSKIKGKFGKINLNDPNSLFLASEETSEEEDTNYFKLQAAR